MAEERHKVNKKSPVGAAVLSALFPGVGFFYIGNFLKGIAYILVFISLIVLASHGRDHEIAVFVLMCVGFYIFQIFDSFDETRNAVLLTETEIQKQGSKMTLFASVSILVIGILFQLESLGIIRFRHITKLWPLALIVLGSWFVYTYLKDKDVNQEGEENE